MNIDVAGHRQPERSKAINGYISTPQQNFYRRVARRMRHMKPGSRITVKTEGSLDALRVLVKYGRIFLDRPFVVHKIDYKTVRIESPPRNASVWKLR